MEPRPPRPRSTNPFESPASQATSGIGDRLYPTPGESVYYGGDEANMPGTAAQPLLHRRQRRQQGALRAIAAVLVTAAIIAGLGWFFRDTLRSLIAPPAPSATVVAPSVAEATPTAETSPAETPSGELANALATVTPTAAVRAQATESADATAQPTRALDVADTNGASSDISAQTRPLLDLLPTQSQVPAGLILTNEAERSKAEVVEQLGDTAEAAQLLDDWGWSGNAYRDFNTDPNAADPSTLNFLNVSVHRFADAESAANAMVFFSDQVIFVQGLEEVEAPAIGESARLLKGAPDGLPLTVLYVQQGPIMYRIGGSAVAADGDPTADVLSVASAIISGQSDGGE
jgi:hypothetical protein